MNVTKLVIKIGKFKTKRFKIGNQNWLNQKLQVQTVDRNSINRLLIGLIQVNFTLAIENWSIRNWSTPYSKIGETTKIGEMTKIGETTKIGEPTKIGETTKIGEMTKNGRNDQNW